MEVVERKRSRGGFLNLFDWPGKSLKKKQFSSGNSELSEEPKQTTHNEVDEIGKNWNYNPRSDSSCCASSVTSDDGHGTRAPSVVARLMGLESLPEPNVQEPRFHPSLDSFLHSKPTNKWNAYENLGYVNLNTDYDRVSREHLDSRPIERFQSETFPPKLAKPISVANNRLLSPIRSPEFVPSRNLVYVMEAASRMVEPSPRTRMVSTRTRFSSPSDSPSSVPMRIRDLREKLKAAKKASSRQVSNATFNEKRASTSVMTTSSTSKFMGKNNSDGLKSKVKPPYVTAQVKNSTMPLSVHKEKAEPKNRIVKSQNGLSEDITLAWGRVFLSRMNRNRTAGTTNIQTKKSKVVNKVPVESGSGKNTSLSSSHKKSLPRSKKPRNGMQECGISNDKRIKRSESVIKCNITIDGGLHSGKDDWKKEVDVISFTFSSSDSLSSTQVTDQDTDSMFGGHRLNVLLEQKLRELTSKLEFSSCSLTQEESSPSSAKDESHLAQDESELSECVTTLTYSEDEERLDWEVEYISEILNSDQLMVKEFALGMATDILPLSLFNEMECPGEAAAAKLKRKTVFDFLNKYLALKYEQMFRGSCKRLLWKEGFLFEHRDWLAEELNREVQRLKKMRGMRMDELVDKYMSSLEGSWLDFEREAYEEGVDIEGEIVSTLVDDLVNDLVSVFKEEH